MVSISKLLVIAEALKVTINCLLVDYISPGETDGKIKQETVSLVNTLTIDEKKYWKENILLFITH